MYIVSNDFHEYLQHKLSKWFMKQSKLILNTYAGKSDSVITVSQVEGITFNLIHFNERYLDKYYSSDKFEPNAEKVLKAMAHITKLTADEMKKSDLVIAAKVKLYQREVTKTLRYERFVMYISV